MKTKTENTVIENKFIHFDKNTLMDKENGMLYDKETLKLVGHYNY